MVYKESATAPTGEIERLRHENAILCSGVRPSSEQDCKLKEVYHRLGNAEHGWNHTRLLLDITREEVETCTHGIIHLEHHVEVQDAELEESAETIANLEQQLLELLGQAPPEPADPEENDAMSGIDEDLVSPNVGCGETKFWADRVRLASSLIACNLGCDPRRGNKVLMPILFLLGGFHLTTCTNGM
jgi:hypothetical protein